MIGKLTGRIESFGDDYLILDVGGVGYIVYCSSRTLQTAPRLGEAASFAIEMQVREDAIRLYGFVTAAERDWFRLLQTVQGVGAKVALALLGVFSPADLARAVALQDKTAVARAQGVGPKLAQRIVSELKDKAPASSPLETGAAQLAQAAGEAPKGAAADAVSALVNLGYGRPQSALAVAAAVRALGEDAQASALIRRGLRELAQ